MAGSSSSTEQDRPLSQIADPSQPLLLTAPPHPSASSRRIPPPCWSHEETVALIDSYRDKWYSLRRTNLKATDWQNVADAVRSRCPLTSPAKTAVQCRHKMEKLRKRYRTEIQRAKSMPVAPFISSWVHFNHMDFMEEGPQASNPAADSKYDDEVTIHRRSNRNLYKSTCNGANGVSIAKPGNNFRPKTYSQFDKTPNPSPNLGIRVLNVGPWAKPPRLGKRSLDDADGESIGKRRRESEGNAVADTVNAIKVLGDGIVKMEQLKMEMAREIETMRIDMEMKRTEMILESQERIVEAFAQSFSAKQKRKH